MVYLQSLDRLPTRYDGRVRNFLEYYVGTPGHPAPFGGRQADLAALDAWLADPDAPPTFIIAGEPGIGKTAVAAACGFVCG